MFAAWRARRARAAADRVEAARREAAARVVELQAELEAVDSFQGVGPGEGAVPISLGAGEHALFSAAGAGLVDTRRQPGHYQGGSHGVSVRVPGTRSMRYRVGATRGTYIPGASVPTRVDTGSFTVTTRRAVFVGDQATREWNWSKLVGVTHHDRPPWTAIAVSNRQKVSGVLYDAANAAAVRFWIDLAVARACGTTPQLVARLTAELTAARAAAVASLPPPGSASP